ncbi:ATP-binding cassette domain-containing protein [Pseudoalteromonas sp. MM17-2]|uniref:ATP-binding cassette domain-containing protein n=1 Tax=Pseudoalteromonas sp. MM17-2 TaxID=2917753 RepID=UPI001EF65C77|nr:ATP-binding cassette domain-containing protein [Pseudoalteromonas sp. MM17-2]MCG7542742.1 ATP-binding cassette domain-containing protein [Pseudoalteromonas sp. MM17-2]
MTIEPGESLAITGKSGCGKSTLFHLLQGLSEPTEGEVLIDGISIKDITPSCYRSQIASVMQDDHLLSGTILENITFFEPDADIDLAKECAKLAHIDVYIHSLPMGYNTLIGEMGSILSGGQKQRLLLARALYRKPKILFLDEATSHLDVELERKINDSVRQLDITRVVIAHRKETIATSDRAIALWDL